MSWLAAGCAALAVLLLVRAPARVRGPEVRHGRGPVLPLVAGGVAATLLVPRVGPVVLVAVGASVGALGLWRRRRRRREAELVGARVLETCELLAGELAAGRPPGDALDRAAAGWGPLVPVAEAFRVGSDVPAALRRVGADLDGARDLRIVAGAWQVAHRTGDGLAGAVERVAESLRADAAARRVVAGELASARATARLVAALPVLALAMGSGAGGDPWAFLLGSPAGLACLAGGLGFGLAGLWWIEAIARDVGGAA